jgi:DNA-binding beta-propeller fold protein YncE
MGYRLSGSPSIMSSTDCKIVYRFDNTCLYAFDISISPRRILFSMLPMRLLTKLPAALASVLAAALVSSAAPTLALAQAGPYKVINTIKVGGEGGYDYITADSAARRLYIARSGAAGKLFVYNLDTFAPVGSVATGSAHGATVDAASHHGFATSKPVTMFDAGTLEVIKTIDTGGNPDGYLADPDTHRIYILSHSAPQVTAINAADGAIFAQLPIDGAVEQAVLDGKGHLYIDLEDKDAIAVVDTKTLTLTATYDISSAGGGCAGLAIDRAHGVLFASCRDKNNMIIVSAATGKIITSLPIGVGSDGAVFNAKTGEAFSTQGDGTLTVITGPTLKMAGKGNQWLDPKEYTVEQTVKTPPRARTITLDEKTGHIITITAEFGPAPPPVAPGQRPGRPPMIPGSFEIVVVGK